MAENDKKTPRRPGFNEKGEPYKGVDPKTGERKALNFEDAKKEFGPKRGEEVYREVAQAGGFGRVEGNPDLSLVGLPGEEKQQIERILASAGSAQAPDSTTTEGGKV